MDDIDRECYENEGKRIKRQNQYNKDLNEQINNSRAMRSKFEKDYNQKVINKIYEEKIQEKKGR